MTVVAPAKLTTTLRITGVRSDGLHELDAEMVALDLADELRIEPGGTGLTVEGPYADVVPTDGGNLVARALVAAGRRAAVHLVKRIPPGGGLGGGSSDAAAVLRWAGVTDAAVAASLGADVPFCLIGGRARVRGVGELIEPRPFRPLAVTLVVPPLVCSTPAVYRRWEELGRPTADGPNDLEPAALAAVPELAWWRDRIGDLTGQTPVLAGSGSTWFVEGWRDDALAPLTGEGACVIVARALPSGG
jgi:4-diphosphocytidyl-2-C-methyl-D-erythritol kinase